MPQKSHHHHLEHFRGAKVYEGERVLLDNAEGELTYREKSGGRREWHGFIEVPNSIHIEAGAHLKLVLADRREAEINAADIRGSEIAGRATHAVEFYVAGDLHVPGRGRLSSPAPRRLGG
jgi:hypothetical protein